MNMKAKLIILFAVVLGLLACENQEIEFEDYGTTAVYFPFQRPARTLILGKYDVGINENDNNHRFEVGVALAGVYENREPRQVHFQVDNSLLDEASNVVALPSEYYTIETPSPVTIPVGEFKGRIAIQLSEQFFEDSLSIAPLNEVNYALPLVITQVENVDSVLSGIPALEAPTLVRDSDWSVLPKNYTLYGIKFINKYHGNYLRRGVDEMTNDTGLVVKSIYHNEYVERDELVLLTTTGKLSVELSNIVRRGELSSPGSVRMELRFDQSGSCTAHSFGSDTYDVSGSGSFMENGDSWGGKARDAIFLNYTYTDTLNNEVHMVTDTLVIRDRNVVFEEFALEF